MTETEIIISILPLFLAIVVMAIIVHKAGIFQQREHRVKMEKLLERIANAVEKIVINNFTSWLCSAQPCIRAGLAQKRASPSILR